MHHPHVRAAAQQSQPLRRIWDRAAPEQRIERASGFPKGWPQGAPRRRCLASSRWRAHSAGAKRSEPCGAFHPIPTVQGRAFHPPCENSPRAALRGFDRAFLPRLRTWPRASVHFLRAPFQARHPPCPALRRAQPKASPRALPERPHWSGAP